MSKMEVLETYKKNYTLFSYVKNHHTSLSPIPG